MRYCLTPGCPVLVERGHCPRHVHALRRLERRHYSGTPTVNYGRRWRRAREVFLAASPACVECKAAGILEPATEVDHVIPHQGDPVKFWDRRNWQALCRMHHSLKTARETLQGNT